MWALRSAALAIAALTGACGIAKFETAVSDQATIPGTFLPNAVNTLPYGGSFNNLNLSSDQTFQNMKVKPSDVQSILIKSVHVEGTVPMRDDLGAILSTLALSVAAPGLDKKRFAHLDMFPEGPATDLTLDDPTFDLKPYATAAMMTISAEVKLKQRPAFDTTIKTTVTLIVDPHLL